MTNKKTGQLTRVERAWREQTNANKKKYARNTKKSIERDYSKMKLVKVDHRTSIYVPIGADEQQAIENYHKARQ